MTPIQPAMMNVYYFAICFLSFSVYSTFSGISPDCPCSYNATAQTSICTGQGLASVPSCVPSQTRRLYLDRNEIENISAGLFERFAELEVLNLDRNLLEHLYDDSFQGLKHLRTLSLWRNRLQHNDSFSDNVFSPLLSLQNLHIHGNCDAYSGMKCTYPHVALSKATTLIDLFLDGFPSVALGEGFRALKSLKSLRMDSEIGFCSLGHVPQDIFLNLRNTNISKIEINHCRIQKLPPNTFSDLPTLEILEMYFYRDMSNDAIFNITAGLNSPNLRRLSLTQIYSYHGSSVLPADTFKDLKKSKLETLELTGDKIQRIDRACISNLPKTLKYMNLSDNIIGDADVFGKLYVLENLKIIDISYQNHYTVDANRHETHRSHQNNESFKLESSLFGPPYHRVGQTSNDNEIKLPPNIEIIIMNDVKLDYPVPSLRFSPNKLKLFNASNCMLKAFLGPWFGLRYLEVLDLSNNNMKLIYPTTFTEFYNLTSLFLQGNKIGPNILMDTKCEMFSSQMRLELLDLSDNDFHDLPSCMFEPLRKLRWLSLKRNALTTIGFQIDSLVHLQTLDLSNNQLMSISQQTLSAFDRLSKGTELSLDIQGNHFSCGCKDKYFVDWLMSSRLSVIGINTMSCTYENKTKVSLADISQIAVRLRDDCPSWIIVTVCAVTFFTLLLVLGFIAMICHKRDKYMYLFRTGRKTLNPYHKLRNENVRVDMDAYISYDQDFEVFDGMTLHQVIDRHIYPGLKQKGLRIKIREELDGNRLLSTMISEQLQHCHKVVVLLTEDFCKDFANSHEFHVAATEGIYTNRSTIIPVLVGQSAWDNLLPEMRSFLQSEEIAYFPNAVENIGEFIDYLESRILRW